MLQDGIKKNQEAIKDLQESVELMGKNVKAGTSPRGLVPLHAACARWFVCQTATTFVWPHVRA